ncbi:MAG: hypothetical protein ACJAUP_000438 [Cellvibrionaceae bacterium]|jgi:hypothetical protein
MSTQKATRQKTIPLATVTVHACQRLQYPMMILEGVALAPQPFKLSHRSAQLCIRGSGGSS